MNIKYLSKFGIIGSVGCAGYSIGILVERYKNERISRLPGLPVFGSVSAATPFSSDIKPATGQEVAPIIKSNRIGQIMKYGFPSLDNVKSMENYVLAYDKRNRVAHWVFEHLTPESVAKNNSVDRSKCEFIEDSSIHKYFRSQNSDYKGSGFDRGHLAAAGNHRLCQEDVNRTFLLSNMAPQVGTGFNRDSWNRLESHVRRLTRTYSNVYVCTGPLYLPKIEADGKTYVKYQVIGLNHVAVPTHFFKVIVMEAEGNKLHMEAYVMPNQKIDDKVSLKLFLVPPETIERASGLLFFDKMSRNNLVQINGQKTTFV